MTRTRAGLAAAVAALLLLAAAGPARAAVLATGTLTNAQGAPAAGEVRVYGWVFPKQGQTRALPLLGTAAAGSDGVFSVNSLDDAGLRRLASGRGGWVDFTIVGQTGGHTGMWGYSAYVDAPGGVARVASVDAATGLAATARAAGALASAPNVTVRADRPNDVTARAAQIGRCDGRLEIQPVGSMRKLTIVGELNNAYNDGTKGVFSYGRGNQSETVIGAASQLTNGSWEISAEYMISDEGKVTFPTFDRRLSRKLRSLFEYTKYRIRASECAVWEPFVRATAWIGDLDMSVKQDGLDKCDARHLFGYPGGASFERNDGRAVRYNKAVDAFGVSLTARSGYTRNVSLSFTWGGRETKRHYICGEDGKQSPFTSGRVFTGSRK